MKYVLLLPMLLLLFLNRGMAADSFVYCSAAADKQVAVFRLQEATGALTAVHRLSVPGEPGGMTITPDGKLLLVALRSTGQLASCRINPVDGTLTLSNIVEAGADPAQISMDRTGRFLFTAYYVAAKVSVHRLLADGRLSQKPVQELPTTEKAHAIMVDVSNRFVFVPHTGPNTIFQFQFDVKSGFLTPHEMSRLDRPVHTGPRHLAWHPSKAIAYIDNEQGNSVTAYEVQATGSLLPGSSASTLPGEFIGSNSTAEIKVHPSGHFLYVSNRGHDSIAQIGLDDSGKTLSHIATYPTEQTPRSFNLDSTGNFLLVAGESSGRLEVSRIDGQTGALKMLSTHDVGASLWWVETMAVPAADAP